MLSCNAYAFGSPDAPSACTFCLSCVTTPATAMCTQCFVQGVRTSQGCEVAPSQLITKLHHSLALRGYVSSTKFADELGLASKVNMSSQCASGVDSYQMWGNDPVANASAGGDEAARRQRGPSCEAARAGECACHSPVLLLPLAKRRLLDPDLLIQQRELLVPPDELR